MSMKKKGPKPLDKKAKAILQNAHKNLLSKQIHQQHIQQCMNVILTQYNIRQGNDLRKVISDISPEFIQKQQKILNKIKDREKLIKQCSEIFVTIKQIPLSLIDKIGEQSKKLIDQIEQWLEYMKKFGSDRKLLLKNSIYNVQANENYIEVFFYRNHQIIDNIKSLQIRHILKDPNPTLLSTNDIKKGSEFIQRFQEVLKNIFGQQASQAFHQLVQDIKGTKQEELRQKSLRKIQEFEQMKRKLHKEAISYESVDILKKYQSLAVSPKKPSSNKNIDSRVYQKIQAKRPTSNKTLNMQKYYSKLQRLKQSLNQPIKTRSKYSSFNVYGVQSKLKVKKYENTVSEQNIISDSPLRRSQIKKDSKGLSTEFKKTKIKLIGQKQYNKEEFNKNRSDLQKAYIITNKIPESIQFSLIKQSQSQTREKQSNSQYENMKKKYISQRQSQQNQIHKSLKQLKQTLNNKQPIYSVIRDSRKSQFSEKNYFDDIDSKSQAFKLQSQNYGQKEDNTEVQFKKHAENITEQKKQDYKVKQMQQQIVPVSQIIQNKSVKKKGLYNEQEYLEQILEDIQNQNAQKENELSKHKLLSQEARMKKIEKKQRIQQLQTRIRQYGVEPEINKSQIGEIIQQNSQKHSNKQLKQLKSEKKQMIHQISCQKQQFVKQIKKVSEKLLHEEQKFTELKQEEQIEDEKILRNSLVKQSQFRIKELENKTVQLKTMIQKEEQKRKINEKQLQEQIAKNQDSQKQLAHQQELQKLLLAQLQKASKAKEQRRKLKQKKEKQQIEKLKKEINSLQEQQKATLLQHNRDSQAMHSMFESIRRKNLQLEASIRKKRQISSETRSAEEDEYLNSPVR